MPGVPTADALIADLADRNPPERVSRAIESARAMSDVDRRELLADLAGREAHYRCLAVTMAAATGESGQVLAASRDPYPAVRARALDAPGLADEAVAGLLGAARDGGAGDGGASLADRLALYRRLRRRRRHDLADRLLPVVRERWGDHEAARLLTACSGPAVADALPALGYAVASWTGLTTRHPEVVVAHAAAELATLDAAGRDDWWSRADRIESALAVHRPAALLDLYERFRTGPSIRLAHLGRLLAVDAPRVARLLLADPERVTRLAGGRLTRSVRDRLAGLPDSDLGALLHASGPAPALVAAVLRARPPARREAVFDLAYAGRELTARLLPEDVLTVLPHARRHAEARRMLALPVVATDAAERLRITAFLPYPEAAAALDGASRSAEAEERGQAYESLVRCAARTGDPATVTALLAGLTRIRNERDPVRSRLLAALAGVRPELFEAAAVEALDRLIRDSLDARDCSWQTGQSVNRLVFGVLWASMAAGERQSLLRWALETVERITEWRRTPVTADLSRVLRRGQEHEVFARMRPRLIEGLRRKDPWPLLVFAGSLGKRAWQMPDLQDLLRRATKIKDDMVVTTAVRLWLASPKGRAAKVARLVARDESTVALPEVLSVAVRRTDLLRGHVLAGRRLRGRFGTGKAAWVPVVDRAALALWSPDEVGRYATLVLRAVHDEGLDRWRRARLARIEAGLPGRDPTAVSDLIAGEDVLFAEAALAGLADGDRPDLALPVLLDNVHGDRARVAVFAAARCARDVAPADLAGILHGALVEAPKVTVRKEVVRLLSVMRVPGAVEALTAAWHRDGQHRDVKVAIAVALRDWLDDPRSWTLLEAAAVEERHVAEALLDANPYRVREPDRERYGALVRGLTRHPDPEVAHRAYPALAAWTPWAPDSAAEIVTGVTDMAPGWAWRSAADCAVHPTAWAALPDLLPDLASALLVLAASDPDAEPQRDLPARQRLRCLVGGLLRARDAVRRQPAPVRRMIPVLAADPTFATEAARLAATLLRPGPGFDNDLAAVADLLADLPHAVTDMDRYCAVSEWDPAEVGPGVDALTARGDFAGGLLALALVRVAAARAGWPEDWRRRLRGLRRHPDRAVRHAALRVFSALE
jgi:hypothetical protein